MSTFDNLYKEFQESGLAERIAISDKYHLIGLVNNEIDKLKQIDGKNEIAGRMVLTTIMQSVFYLQSAAVDFGLVERPTRSVDEEEKDDIITRLVGNILTNLHTVQGAQKHTQKKVCDINEDFLKYLIELKEKYLDD